MSKSDEIEPPAVFTASDAAFMLPPPSYQEVMGVYQTSVKQVQEQQTDMPPLSYIDIMPRCLKNGNIKGRIKPTFDNFSGIMEGANRWLREHPGLQVWKCETVRRRLGTTPDGKLTYDLNDMLRPDPTFGYVVLIRGLRLWLTKNNNPGSTPQQLGLRNELPAEKEILIPVHYNRGRYGFFGMGDAVVMQGGIPYYKYTTFENLYNTIDKLNQKLETEPIQGTILTVETDFIKASEWMKNELDPEAACWHEDKMKFRRETQVIRIFYIKGASARETIGIKDFVPELLEKGTITQPAKFEQFDPFMENVTSWVPANQGIRVVNIQQKDITVDKELGGDVSISPEDTDEMISTFFERRVVKTYRLFYVKSPAGAAPQPTCVTSRLFTPARTGPRSFETMTQTMDRIDAWLKVTGLPIFSVCTVENPYNEHSPEGMDTRRTDYCIPATSAKKWLTAIRVFFPAGYQEPDPSLLPPKPEFKQGSSSCNIL